MVVALCGSPLYLFHGCSNVSHNNTWGYNILRPSRSCPYSMHDKCMSMSSQGLIHCRGIDAGVWEAINVLDAAYESNAEFQPRTLSIVVQDKPGVLNEASIPDCSIATCAQFRHAGMRCRCSCLKHASDRIHSLCLCNLKLTRVPMMFTHVQLTAPEIWFCMGTGDWCPSEAWVQRTESSSGQL